MSYPDCLLYRIALELDQYSGAAGDLRGQPGVVAVPIRLLADVRQALAYGCVAHELRERLTAALKEQEPRVKTIGVGR